MRISFHVENGPLQGETLALEPVEPSDLMDDWAMYRGADVELVAPDGRVVLYRQIVSRDERNLVKGTLTFVGHVP